MHQVRLTMAIPLTYLLCLLSSRLQLKYFLPDPIANDVKYQASAQPFLVFGLLTTGLAVGAANAAAGL
jgi:chlorophyll synthase